jgi:dTDP-4-amino-4,6-dideoxygalactose transaminase
MSLLTRKLIGSLDVDHIVRVRRDNFSYLDERCAGINRLDLEQSSLFMYPLYVRNGSELRSYLIKNKVFTPTLWADQLHLVTADLEHDLIENIVHLPIDQRYTADDMERIADLIHAYYE